MFVTKLIEIFYKNPVNDLTICHCIFATYVVSEYFNAKSMCIKVRRLMKVIFLIAILVVPLLLFQSFLFINKPLVKLPLKFNCFLDRTTNETKICQPKCPYGFFGLPHMNFCHKWLNCDDIKLLNVSDKELKHSYIKSLYLAQWTNYTIVYANLTEPENLKWRGHFAQGIQMFKTLHHVDNVAEFLGSCNDTVLLLQYYPLGDLTNIEIVLNRYPQYATIETRFGLCKSLTHFFAQLLTLEDGPRVMEDTDSLKKFSSQFLMRENLNTVVAVDIDILPFDESLTHCRDKLLFGDFLPPELLCDFENQSSKVHYEVPITHKSDVWKLGNICEFLLYFENNDLWKQKLTLKQTLVEIFNECRNHNPLLRPNALQVLHKLNKIHF